METTAATVQINLFEAPTELTEAQNQIKHLSTKLATLLDDRDRLREQEKGLTATILDTQVQLQQRMDAQDITTFKTPRGTFYKHTQLRASVADADTAFAFLRSSGNGGLIKETVNAQSLSSAMSQLVSEGVMLLTDLEAQGIRAYIDESIRVRGRTV